MSSDFWRGKRVMITGHTGFKGGWLTFWLSELGAEIAGLGLACTIGPNLFDLLNLADRCQSTIGDINQPGALAQLIDRFRPEIVIHMAAQALVRPSYDDPIGTYETNVLGVVRLLDAVRHCDSVRSVVVVTSDKCYENREQIRGYREGDAMGGHDPYSSSKGAAEIASQSMQRSFFQPFVSKGHPARIATVRAGNVIGGGDWSQDRLVPDIVRSCLDGEGNVELRNPNSIRPWQHVFDPLAFYMDLAQRLSVAPDAMDCAWNIGPDETETHSVRDVTEAMIKALGRGRLVTRSTPEAPHEAQVLALDCTKAREAFGWRPRWNFDAAIQHTAEWYAAWSRKEDLVAISRLQLDAFNSVTD